MGSGSEICDLPNEATGEPWEPSFSGVAREGSLGGQEAQARGCGLGLDTKTASPRRRVWAPGVGNGCGVKRSRSLRIAICQQYVQQREMEEAAYGRRPEYGCRIGADLASFRIPVDLPYTMEN